MRYADRGFIPPVTALGPRMSSVLNGSMEIKPPQARVFDISRDLSPLEWEQIHRVAGAFLRKEVDLEDMKHGVNFALPMHTYPIVALSRLGGQKQEFTEEERKEAWKDLTRCFSPAAYTTLNLGGKEDILKHSAYLRQIMPDSFPQFGEEVFDVLPSIYSLQVISSTLYTKILFPQKSVDEIIHTKVTTNTAIALNVSSEDEFWEMARGKIDGIRGNRYAVENFDDAYIRLLFPERWKKECTPDQAYWDILLDKVTQYRNTRITIDTDVESLYIDYAMYLFKLVVLAAEDAYIDKNGQIVIVPHGTNSNQRQERRLPAALEIEKHE